MNNKKVISMFAIMSLVGSAAAFVSYRNFTLNDGIKVLDYKSSSIDDTNSSDNIIAKDSYQMSKIENINGVMLINDKEVLNLKLSDKFNEYSGDNYYTCSIYNTETKKEERNFDDVCIDESGVFGISPNRKYLLYKEGKDTSKFGNMTKNDYMSKDNLTRKIKILDLTTGEITDFGTNEYNASIDFRWISDNKIIYNVGNLSGWAIADRSGKICMQGNINGIRDILDVDEAKEVGNTVQGEMYYYRLGNNSEGKEVYIIEKYNLSTKKITKIKETDMASQLNMSGGIIGQTLIGTEMNYINENGKILKSLNGNSEKGLCYATIVSKDGGKGAFIYSKDTSIEECTGLNIFDIKSGTIKEIAKIKDFINTDVQNDYIIEYHSTDKKGERTEVQEKGNVFRLGTVKRNDLAWSSDGKSLIFTYHYNSKEDNKNRVDSYIVKFE